MLIYKTDKNYGVYLEEDGDDLWVTVTNGYCKSFDCIVGGVENLSDTKMCIENAWYCFSPAQYVSEGLEHNDTRLRVFTLAKDAYEIDRALEMALSA